MHESVIYQEIEAKGNRSIRLISEYGEFATII